MPAADNALPGGDREGPLGDDELDAIFAPLSGVARVAIAVSGGSDSLALLDAVDRWRRKSSAEVVVLTVDHQLRAGSRAEALAVAKVARTRGLQSHILTWEGAKPTGDVEAVARAARYRLLFAKCREIGVSHLLLAHHRDDLAETFLLRLKRGSGVFGLAAMRSPLNVGDVTIFRPFLSFSRARLAATTAAAGLKPADDPMNADPRFDRARIRRLLPKLAGEGIDPAELAATALRLADAADAIDAAATALLKTTAETDELATARLNPAQFVAAPIEVGYRALVRLLIAIGGDDYPPRHERLVALADAMMSTAAGRLKRTLAGTVIERRGGRVVLYRESGREGLPEVNLVPGDSIVWDHRFVVEVERRAPKGLVVGPLGEEGRRAIGATGTLHPVGAVAALPAITREGRLIAVPSLGWGDVHGAVTIRSIVGERLARPPLFPDLAGR